MGLIENNQMEYWRVSDGKIRRTSDENDPLATKRTVKLKDGTEKEMWEQVNKGVSGIITDLQINDGKFGRQLILTVKDVEMFAITMGWESPYARTLLEKIQGVDLTKQVSIIPYDFAAKDGRNPRGISLYQEDKKILSYYKEYDLDGKFVDFKDGYPHFEEGMEGDDIKIMSAQQMKFLKENVVDKFPFGTGAVTRADTGAVKPEKKTIDGQDDLPF